MALLPEAPNPYRPPSAADDRPIRASYVSQRSRAQRLQRLLGIFMVVTLVNALADLLDIGVLSSRDFDEAAAEALDMRAMVVGLACMASFAVTAVVFARFLMQANRNTVFLGRPVQQFSPASMLWWHFVPLLNLIKPYYAVREVWTSSCSGDRAGLVPPIVGAWWSAWVIGAIVGRAASRMAIRAETPQELLVATLVDVVACGALIAAASAARKVIVALSELQDETWINRQ